MADKEGSCPFGELEACREGKGKGRDPVAHLGAASRQGGACPWEGASLGAGLRTCQGAAGASLGAASRAEASRAEGHPGHLLYQKGVGQRVSEQRHDRDRGILHSG